MIIRKQKLTNSGTNFSIGIIRNWIENLKAKKGDEITAELDLKKRTITIKF